MTAKKTTTSTEPVKTSERGRITISGTEYPIIITMGALLRFARLTGKDASNIGASTTDTVMFIWCCLESSAKHQGKGLPWKDLEDFADSLLLSDLSSLTWE